MIGSPKQALGLSLPIQLGNSGYFDTNNDTISQISDNIKNLLLTRPGERRFNNSFGSNLYNMLFEQISIGENNDIILDMIQRNISQFLPGVNIVDIQISNDNLTNNNKNSIFISIKFNYNNTFGDVELTLENNRM
jgi:phage baseplate assembly protein W